MYTKQAITEECNTMIISNDNHRNYSDSKEITLKVENLKVYASAGQSSIPKKG